MKNRVLFLLEVELINEVCINELCILAKPFDEAIFVIKDADMLHASGNETGHFIYLLHKFVVEFLSIPFFVIPYPSSDDKSIQYWIGLKLITPAFASFYSNNVADEFGVVSILKSTFHLLPPGKKLIYSILKTSNKSIKRGLYVTRAQPFHIGHASYVKQMANECDELIVLIGAAEQSHVVHNPLSASERMEMVNDYLFSEFPGKYYILALPQNYYTLGNMLELEYLLPSYHTVYATNPIITSMCNVLNIPVKILTQKNPISATEIRNKIMNDQSYDNMVPDIIYKHMEKLNFKERLLLINREDIR